MQDAADAADGRFTEDDDDSYDVGLPVEPGRPAAPVLTGAPLTLHQALERLQAVMDSLDRAADGLDELDRSGSTLIDDARDLVSEQMNDTEFSVLITFLLQAWFALVPFGVRAPTLHFATMEAAMAAADDGLRPPGRLSRSDFERLMGGCRQPGLLQALAGGVMEGLDKLPKASRPSPPAVVSMVFVLKVVLDELDRALRA